MSLVRPAAALVAVAGAALALACAAGPAPFDVRPGNEARFEETGRLCHRLTDADDGTPDAERFDACMERRGFHRQGPVTRAWRGLTGG